MAILKQSQGKNTAGYRGKQAKTGNSLGRRFDKALPFDPIEDLGDEPLV
jgi:hypothetical protein